MDSDSGGPVQLSFHLSRAAVDPPDGTRLIVMARFKTLQDPGFSRAPLNLSFVLDRSGSMQGDKLQQCKHAVRYAISNLTDRDHGSVVLFDDKVDVLVAHDRVVSKDRLLHALASVESRGSTNLSDGWSQGGTLVEGAATAGTVSRVLLLTDGQANAGVVQHGRLCQMAQDLLGRGVLTTTIGFGTGFNEELLRGMADAGGGNFHFVETADEAPTIFAREFDELLRVAAQNVRLCITPADAVQFLGCLQDFPADKTADGTTIKLGDLCAGDEKNVLFEFFLPANRTTQEVARLDISYQQVIGDVALRQMTASIELPANGMGDVTVNTGVWREVLLAEVAREMQAALREADAGNLEDARNRLDRARGSLDESAHKDDPTFKEQSSQLTRMRDHLKDKDSYSSIGRKSLSYSSVSLGRLKRYSKGGQLSPETRKDLLGARKVVFVTEEALSPDLQMLARFAHRWPETVLVTPSEELGEAVQPLRTLNPETCGSPELEALIRAADIIVVVGPLSFPPRFPRVLTWVMSALIMMGTTVLVLQEGGKPRVPGEHLDLPLGEGLRVLAAETSTSLG